MYRQVSAERYIKANPKLKINFNVTPAIVTPTVTFTFVNGNVLEFECEKFICKDMMFKTLLTASELDIEYEMAGKSIDEE